jgi:hypothetical protein
MNRVTLNTIAACALALVAGFAAGSGRAFSPAGKGTPSPAHATLETPQANEPLARAVKTEMGAKRWLLLVAAAETATANDMPGIIRAAGDDSAAVRMLAAHWAALDPKHMFASLYADFLLPDGSPVALPQRSALMDSLFEEWSKSDPAGVVKALTDVPDFSGREAMRHNVINRLMATDVETGLGAMGGWNITNYLPRMKQVAEWAARDLPHATQVAAKSNQGYAAREVLKEIGKAWAESDPEGGLRLAATLDAQSRAALGPEILRVWAAKDIAAAAQFASGQTDIIFRNALAQGLVSTWGKEDPAAALDWSQENLVGKARTEAIGGIVAAAAKKDLVTAGALVAGMEPGAAQNRAAASLFEVWFQKGEDQRAAAIEWLAALPDKEAQRTALDRVQWDWMWKDPDGVRDFIAGPHGELASSHMVNQLARNEAMKNPGAALEWVTKLPADRQADARASVVESWMRFRPEAAADYARNLPPGPERESTLVSVTQQFTWNAPPQAAAWLLTLPEGERKSILENARFSPEQRRELEAAMKATGK